MNLENILKDRNVFFVNEVWRFVKLSGIFLKRFLMSFTEI